MTAKAVSAFLCLATSLGLASQDRTDALRRLENDFGPPVLYVAKPQTPPALDGNLDDDAWAAAQPVTLGHLTGRWDPPTQKTIARVLADDTKIYFGVRCEDAQPERIVAAGNGKRDGPLWNGDTVEVFLDPGHRSARHEYFHIIVNPDGLVADGKGRDAKAWNAAVEAKTARDEKGWSVEFAVPMRDLGIEGAIPRVWGLNINRQRPELGVVAPKKGIVLGAQPKLAEPDKYREGEDSAWAPTWCHSSHIAQCFGHALVEAGTKEVAPPEKLFEAVYHADFEDGKTGPFGNAEIAKDNFRGTGTCLAPKGGAGAVHFGFGLENVDDLTMIFAMKLPQNGRLYYYGRAPDGMQCDADRHEIFMTREEAAQRTFVGLDVYHTHGSCMAWKCEGRLRPYPGPWALMTGHFAEPSIGSILSPGSDWFILRTRISQFRRQLQQNVVPLEQNYPRGLTFAAGDSPWLLDDFILFRGLDVEPPAQVRDVKIERSGETLALSWPRAKDNTLTAYYEVRAGGKTLAQTHRLSVQVPAAAADGELTVVALDLYGNVSAPSEPVKVAAHP